MTGAIPQKLAGSHRWDQIRRCRTLRKQGLVDKDLMDRFGLGTRTDHVRSRAEKTGRDRIHANTVAMLVTRQGQSHRQNAAFDAP